MRSLMKNPAVLIQHPVSSIQHQKSPLNYHGGILLGYEKNLIRVRILHFGSRRKPFHVDIFAGRVRALYQVRFARDGDSVRVISLGNFCRRSCGGRCCCCRLHWRRTSGLNWSVGIERLLLRRVLLRSGRIIRRSMPSWRRWRLLRA